MLALRTVKKTPLRKMSKAKAVEHRKYLKLKSEALQDNARCEFPDCYEQASQVHHAKGRHGPLLNDKRYWWLLCFEHHSWVHTYPNKARQIEGLLLI